MLSIAIRWGPHFGEALSWAAEDPEGPEVSYREITGHDESIMIDDVGTMLLLENARSLRYRYGQTPAISPYSFQIIREEWIEDPEKCFRPIEAYIYYSSEHPEWPRSEACRFCEALEQTLVICLPRYEQGPWLYRQK